MSHYGFMLFAAGHALLFGTAIYAVLCLLALLMRRRPSSTSASDRPLPPVTILKPLCGAEPRLYENLRSFCTQDYPAHQILFGVRDAHDPALRVARQLQAEFPGRDIGVIVDPAVHGINLKISNLINLLKHARHDWLVLADSDISVRPDYLARVAAPLAQADVGLVTCLYRGRALGGVWSRLGVQFIDDWFLPSVRLAEGFGSTEFGFGATLALRRDTLSAIGGFESLSGFVADDYWLGEFTRKHGLRTVLSDCEVITDVAETSFGELTAHELRWMRTIRSVRPLSYLFFGVCFTLPVAFIGLVLSGGGQLATSLAAIAIIARLVIYLSGQSHSPMARDPGNVFKNTVLFLVRDSLSLFLWACGLFGDTVQWRGQRVNVDTQATARIPN